MAVTVFARQMYAFSGEQTSVHGIHKESKPAMLTPAGKFEAKSLITVQNSGS
jgi:hypothetical protein